MSLDSSEPQFSVLLSREKIMCCVSYRKPQDAPIIWCSPIFQPSLRPSHPGLSGPCANSSRSSLALGLNLLLGTFSPPVLGLRDSFLSFWPQLKGHLPVAFPSHSFIPQSHPPPRLCLTVFTVLSVFSECLFIDSLSSSPTGMWAAWEQGPCPCSLPRL